jgi:hypothetical protein
MLAKKVVKLATACREANYNKDTFKIRDDSREANYNKDTFKIRDDSSIRDNWNIMKCHQQ